MIHAKKSRRIKFSKELYSRSKARSRSYKYILKYLRVLFVQDNGGCNKHARCEQIQPGQRNCTCLRGYVGDGFECRGSTINVSHTAFHVQFNIRSHTFPHHRVFCLSGIVNTAGECLFPSDVICESHEKVFSSL